MIILWSIALALIFVNLLFALSGNGWDLMEHFFCGAIAALCVFSLVVILGYAIGFTIDKISRIFK